MFGFPVSLDPDQLAGITTRLDQLVAQATQIVAQLKLLNQTETKVMSILDDLEKEVGTNTDVRGSIEQLIQNMTKAVENAGADPRRLQAVLTALKNNDERLAQLVLDATPHDPPNDPTPPADTTGLPPG